MKESQVAAMEEFVENIKILINVLGYKVLEPMIQKDSISNHDNQMLYLNVGNASATAMVTTEGFVLIAGSSVNEKNTMKSLSTGMIKLRNKHLESGKVKDWKTTEDILFSSSSAAADFVLGYSVSGPASWKDKRGRTLKEIEAE